MLRGDTSAQASALLWAADVACRASVWEAQHGVLDARQRLVHGEHVGDMLRALGLEGIAFEAANENRMDAVTGMSKKRTLPWADC